MKIVLLVIDGFGIGELPDAKLYGDVGANTYAALNEKIQIPHLVRLGLNNIYGVERVSTPAPIGCYARMRELSCGKDTQVGHHELAGIITYEPAPVFPNGFPKDIIAKLEKAFGAKIIGNKAASGTAIINELGDKHVKSGDIIVYTSADSVMQIACHESVRPIEELYAMCEKARAIMTGDNAVGRIIARPFVGEKGEYYRTENRRDFGLPPTTETMLDRLQSNGVTTVGIGKINDIFCGRGIDVNIAAHSNHDIGKELIKASATYNNAFIFANMVETDMLFGHRRDTYGYQMCMENVDSVIAGLMETLINDDVLIITADHGCDPSFKAHTDHTREYVPLLIHGKNIKKGHDLGTIQGFDTVAHTVLDLFGIMSTDKSIKSKIEITEGKTFALSFQSSIYKSLAHPHYKNRVDK